MKERNVKVKASLHEDFEELRFRVVFPSYGVKRTFPDTNGEVASYPQFFQRDVLAKAKATKGSFSLASDFIQEVLQSSNLVNWTEDALGAKLLVEAVGGGEFELRQGSGVSPAVWSTSLPQNALRSGAPVELGYSSKRDLLDGGQESAPRSYLGTIVHSGEGFITLELGKGAYRSFRLSRILWLVLAPRVRDEPVYHSELLLSLRKRAGGVELTANARPVVFSTHSSSTKKVTDSLDVPVILALDNLLAHAGELAKNPRVSEAHQWGQVVDLLRNLRGQYPESPGRTLNR